MAIAEYSAQYCKADLVKVTAATFTVNLRDIYNRQL